jgi:CO/xanthine dehydrogenase FAD-binding subunit
VTATLTPAGRAGYFAPTTLDAALELLVDDGPTTVVGGGTLVYPRLAREVPGPRRLVDLARLPGIDRLVRHDDGTTTIGAGVTYAALRSPDGPPLLRTLAGGITGGPQIRNQATLGGAACYANPSSDAPGALVALDATVVLAAAGRERRLPAADFFRGPFDTALEAGELLVAVEVPPSAAGGAWGYAKLKHGGSGWPVATASAHLTRGPDRALVAARVTIGAAAAVPVSVELPPELVAELSGTGTSRPLATALRDLVDAAAPRWWSDEQADATYRHRVAPTVAARALDRALDGAPS